MNQQYQLLGVRTPRDNNSGLLAIVSFGFHAGGFEPVLIGHEEKSKNGADKGKYRFYADAEIREGQVVIRSAFLRQGNNGPFLTGAFRGVPFEIRQAVVRDALERLRNMQHNRNNNNNNNNTADPTTIDDYADNHAAA